jgi:hypothetical protein
MGIPYEEGTETQLIYHTYFQQLIVAWVFPMKRELKLEPYRQLHGQGLFNF